MQPGCANVLVSNIQKELCLSKLIIGSTRGFIRGKTLATLDDISSTGNLKMYSLPNHFNENIETYNVGFTIRVVIYKDTRYAQIYFDVPPISYIVAIII